MPLVSVRPQPGVFRESTEYAAEGTWYDCDKIRWRKGSPEKIGGWVKFSDSSFIGAARKIHDWGTISGGNYVALGTTYKLYVETGGDYFDVTPIRATVTLGTDPLDTGSSGSPIITVNHTDHGAVPGDWVTISGATTWDGITTGAINTEHRIIDTPDADSYRIVVSDVATTGSVSGGGSAVVVEYQINIGLNTFLSGSGWGSGTWGSGTWGGATAVTDSNQLRLWSIDNYGDDFVSCVRQGDLYYWDESAGTGTRAITLAGRQRAVHALTPDPLTTTISSSIVTVMDIVGHGAGVGDEVTIAGATDTNGISASVLNDTHTIVSILTDSTYTIDVGANATSSGTGGGSSVTATYNAGIYYTPIKALQVMTSPVARHVIAFGCNPIGSASLDPMEVRWCSQENPADWKPTQENSAGEQRLSAGSIIVGALRTRQEILIWSDVALFSMRYVGPPLVFSFAEVYSNISMISPNAAVAAAGSVYFMDRGGFYAYDGGVRRIPCTVRDYVFSDLDQDQSFKVHAGSNIDKSEVIWFYPSSSGNGEIDKYVKFNYDEGLWDFGTLERSAWNEAPTIEQPIAATVRNYEATNPITTVNSSATVTITYPNHKMVAGDVIIIQGASGVANIPADVLNTAHTVVTAATNSFTITSPITANASTTGGGAVSLLLANHLMAHDVGYDADGDFMYSYIQSADMDIEEGDSFWFVRRMIPDIKYRGTQDSDSKVVIKVFGKDYPLVNRGLLYESTVVPTTEQCDVRFRARQIAVRYESTGSGYGWRSGNLRLDARTDGRR